MATIYFKKEQLSNPVRDRNGRPIAWESCAGNMGVSALDEAAQSELIEDLMALNARKVGGIVPISAERYEDLKKKRSSSPSASKSEMLRVVPPVGSRLTPEAHAAAVAAKAAAAPVVPPTPPATPVLEANFKPRIGRASGLKKKD